ncbi:MAG: hypothetical protein K2N35_05980 [Muribaculaceae bacterium]|nr:hypothetical protein [Muribaculaceae bacterium]
MKTRFIIIYILLSMFCSLRADVNTDRTMSKISRDIHNYLSADCRASTEQEAYDKALELLTEKITSYIQETKKKSPDAVFVPEVASIYQRLDSRISDNRYRVFLYVKKSDLKSLDNSSNAMVIAKTETDSYEIIPYSQPPVVVTDTVTIVEKIEVPMNPIVANIINNTDYNSLQEALIKMRKEGKVSGAAAFPISSLDDFYIAIVRGTSVTDYIHVEDGRWKDVTTGKDVDPSNYSSSSAYWFTIPK